jgi:hypothetical protein
MKQKIFEASVDVEPVSVVDEERGPQMGETPARPISFTSYKNPCGHDSSHSVHVRPFPKAECLGCAVEIRTKIDDDNSGTPKSATADLGQAEGGVVGHVAAKEALSDIDTQILVESNFQKATAKTNMVHADGVIPDPDVALAEADPALVGVVDADGKTGTFPGCNHEKQLVDGGILEEVCLECMLSTLPVGVSTGLTSSTPYLKAPYNNGQCIPIFRPTEPPPTCGPTPTPTDVESTPWKGRSPDANTNNMVYADGVIPDPYQTLSQSVLQYQQSPPVPIPQTIFGGRSRFVGKSLSHANLVHDTPRCWSATRGESVIVAVLDSCFSIVHNNLRDRIIKCKDFTGCHDLSRGGSRNCSGTFVSGIIAADQFVGMAPAARLLIGKVVRDGIASQQNVADGVGWAVAEGADVVCLPLDITDLQGGGPLEKALHAATAAGKIVVATGYNKLGRIDHGAGTNPKTGRTDHGAIMASGCIVPNDMQHTFNIQARHMAKSLDTPEAVSDWLAARVDEIEGGEDNEQTGMKSQTNAMPRPYRNNERTGAVLQTDTMPMPYRDNTWFSYCDVRKWFSANQSPASADVVANCHMVTSCGADKSDEFVTATGHVAATAAIAGCAALFVALSRQLNLSWSAELFRSMMETDKNGVHHAHAGTIVDNMLRLHGGPQAHQLAPAAPVITLAVNDIHDVDILRILAGGGGPRRSADDTVCAKVVDAGVATGRLVLRQQAIGAAILQKLIAAGVRLGPEQVLQIV